MQIFVAVATDGGYRRAADRLGISEASISRHIRALERSWGGLLFDRGRGRTAQLSILGQQVLERAKGALNLQEQIVQASELISNDVEPELLVRPYMLERFVRPNLGRMIEAGLPEGTVFSVVFDSSEMMARIAANRAIFALYRGDVATLTGLQSVLLKQTSMSIYATCDLAEAVENGTREINSIPFVRPRTDRIIREFVMRVLNGARIFPTTFIEGPQFAESWIDHVTDGRAMALFFDDHVALSVSQGTLAPVLANVAPSWFVLTAHQNADPAMFRSMMRACRTVIDI